MARQAHVKTPAAAEVADKQAEVYAKMKECLAESDGTLTQEALAAFLVQQSQLPALCRLLIQQGLITEGALNLAMFGEQLAAMEQMLAAGRAAGMPKLLVPRHETRIERIV